MSSPSPNAYMNLENGKTLIKSRAEQGQPMDGSPEKLMAAKTRSKAVQTQGSQMI